MGKDKDKKKLQAEELEKRVAPLTFYEDTGEPSAEMPSDPTSVNTTSSSGSGKPGKGPK